MLIDSHCHLYLDEFVNDLDEVMKRAQDEDVRKFFLPAIDSETTDAMLDLERRYPGQCFAMMGLHPCSVNENFRNELKLVEEWLVKRPFAAVGEIGLDKYWDQSFLDEQYEAFHFQVSLAIQHKLPIVIHSRNAMQEAIDVVGNYRGNVGGIFHCFGGSIVEARQVIDLGFYLGIGGVLTYKKSGLAEVIKEIGLDNIVLETDAPYLTPVPFRGKRNESSYLKFIRSMMAGISGISEEEVAEITTRNALKVFNAAG